MTSDQVADKNTDLDFADPRSGVSVFAEWARPSRRIRAIYRRLGMVCLSALHVATVGAQSSTLAPVVLDDYRNERYAKAIPALEAAARTGDVQALGLLCEAQMMGRGTERAGKFTRLCEDALDRGSIMAKGLLANWLLISKSPADVSRGFSLAQEAEREGDARAATAVGQAYYFGLGTRRDYAAAYRHFELGRQRGNASAATYLAAYFLNGYGIVEPSDGKAIMFLNEGIAGHHPDAMVLAGKLYELGVIVEKDPVRSLKYYRWASDRHSAEGGYRTYLALRAAANRDALRDEARERLEQAAQDGSAVAAFAHAENFWRGEYGEPDPKTAVGWFRAAASGGIPRARVMLAVVLTESGEDRQGVQLLNAIIRQADNPELSQEAGIALSYLIAQGRVQGTARDIQSLLQAGETSSNPLLVHAAQQARLDINQIAQDRERARVDSNNAYAVGFLALLAAGLLVNASNNGDSSDPTAGDSTLDRINRGLARGNARSACLAACPSNSVYSQMCRETCNR